MLEPRTHSKHRDKELIVGSGLGKLLFHTRRGEMGDEALGWHCGLDQAILSPDGSSSCNPFPQCPCLAVGPRRGSALPARQCRSMESSLAKSSGTLEGGRTWLRFSLPTSGWCLMVPEPSGGRSGVGTGNSAFPGFIVKPGGPCCSLRPLLAAALPRHCLKPLSRHVTRQSGTRLSVRARQHCL